MANTTTPNKIKVLDQMLEDFAGDEFDDFDDVENSASSDVKRYSPNDDLDFFDITH